VSAIYTTRPRNRQARSIGSPAGLERVVRDDTDGDAWLLFVGVDNLFDQPNVVGVEVARRFIEQKNCGGVAIWVVAIDAPDSAFPSLSRSLAPCCESSLPPPGQGQFKSDIGGSSPPLRLGPDHLQYANTAMAPPAISTP
jgi:hypothetical protein